MIETRRRLRVRDVSLAAGGRLLLEHIDFALDGPGIVAIVGPNGAGKSTLLRAMAGLAPVAAGRISLGDDGRDDDIMSYTHVTRARAVALVATDSETPHGMSVLDVAMVGRFSHRAWWNWRRDENDTSRALDALERVGLKDFAPRAFDTLSAGERQRAWIAVALAQDAPFLLLDEPTSHLDVRHALAMLELLRGLARKDGRAIAVVLHDLSEAAAVADRVVVLGNRRQLACDEPARALDPAILQAAFEARFTRLDINGRLHLVPAFEGEE